MINLIISTKIVKIIRQRQNLMGDGNVFTKVVKHLSLHRLNVMCPKSFFDLEAT